MLYYISDKTFDGLLTCVFNAFFRKEIPLKIISEGDDIPLFTDILQVAGDEEKSKRVLSGLKKKVSGPAIHMLYTCYLSELDDIETIIFRYIYKAFQSQQTIELNFADSDVLELSKIYKKVSREEERMRQFVRFQKTSDGIFFAVIEPEYDVLPLTAGFFEDRFADQQWLIYDVRRKYGLFYDLKKTEEVRFDNLNIDLKTGKLKIDLIDEDETNYQLLWKQYFKSINIKERMNLKLQRQHMPKRFWKYLTEKQQ